MSNHGPNHRVSLTDDQKLRLYNLKKGGMSIALLKERFFGCSRPYIHKVYKEVEDRKRRETERSIRH